MPKDEFGWKKANKKKKKKKKYATIGTANFTSLRVEIIINKKLFLHNYSWPYTASSKTTTRDEK